MQHCPAWHRTVLFSSIAWPLGFRQRHSVCQKPHILKPLTCPLPSSDESPARASSAPTTPTVCIHCTCCDSPALPPPPSATADGDEGEEEDVDDVDEDDGEEGEGGVAAVGLPREKRESRGAVASRWARVDASQPEDDMPPLAWASRLLGFIECNLGGCALRQLSAGDGCWVPAPPGPRRTSGECDGAICVL